MLRGDGVQKSEALAYDCFREAAKLGHVRAQYNTGLLLARGIGVGQDLVHAHFWLEKAATQGHERAFSALAPVTGLMSVRQLEQLRLGTEGRTTEINDSRLGHFQSLVN